MSEMKQIADMGPDEASKVFSHVEEKQQIDLKLQVSMTISLKEPFLKII